jgi:hypothetical protein
VKQSTILLFAIFAVTAGAFCSLPLPGFPSLSLPKTQFGRRRLANRVIIPKHARDGRIAAALIDVAGEVPAPIAS